MTFFLLLRESGLDWNKARDTFYNLTDYQVSFLNEASLIEADRIDRQHREQDNRFGKSETRSFDLRGR